MDKRTLKSLIIELKEDNKSFQEISNILSNEYDVQMSRQAICGMYNRAKSDKNINNNMNIILASADIVNYHVLGLSEKEIKDILNNLNILISVNQIKDILRNSNEWIESVYNSMLKKVSGLIKYGYDINDIRLKLQFKGIKPTDSVLKSLIYSYTNQEIEKASIKVITNIINTTDDKSIIKYVNNKFNMNIALKDVSKIMNE